MTTGALQEDTAHIMVPADLRRQRKDPISKDLLRKMLKGVTLTSTARPEVMHEAEMLEVLRARELTRWRPTSKSY